MTTLRRWGGRKVLRGSYRIKKSTSLDKKATKGDDEGVVFKRK